MGVTGSSTTGKMSASLPDLCQRVRKAAGNTPIAVGFGVNSREHFLSVGAMADGIVIGSKLVSIIKEVSPQDAAKAIQDYCFEISKPSPVPKGTSHEIELEESIAMAKTDAISTPTATISTQAAEKLGSVDQSKLLRDPPLLPEIKYDVQAILLTAY
jgi:tryptophan synthase